MATETSPLLQPPDFVGVEDDDGTVTLTPKSVPVDDLALAPPLTVKRTAYGTWQLQDTEGVVCDASLTKNGSSFFEVALKNEKKCVIEVVPKTGETSQWQWPLSLFL